MPSLEASLIKKGFTPEEGRLAVAIEDIIFSINRSVHFNVKEEGVTLEMLNQKLALQDITVSKDALKVTLQKCIDNFVLGYVSGKYYSTTYNSGRQR